jgi:hypothetical protein
MSKPRKQEHMTSTGRKHFPVLLSDDERAALQAVADHAELSASDWIRSTIAKAYRRAFGDTPIKQGPRIKTGRQHTNRQ